MVPRIAEIAFRSRTFAVLAVIAGVLAVPVQCQLQAGPHSVFVQVAALAHHHHHLHHHRNEPSAGAPALAFERAPHESVSPVTPLATVESPVAAVPALLLLIARRGAPRLPRLAPPGRMDWMLALPGAPP